MRGGAKDYLLKDLEPDELIDSLGKIMVGECVVAPEMTGVRVGVSTPLGNGPMDATELVGAFGFSPVKLVPVLDTQ